MYGSVRVIGQSTNIAVISSYLIIYLLLELTLNRHLRIMWFSLRSLMVQFTYSDYLSSSSSYSLNEAIPQSSLTFMLVILSCYQSQRYHLCSSHQLFSFNCFMMSTCWSCVPYSCTYCTILRYPISSYFLIMSTPKCEK